MGERLQNGLARVARFRKFLGPNGFWYLGGGKPPSPSESTRASTTYKVADAIDTGGHSLLSRLKPRKAK